jgi:hypothetical protein
LCGPVRLAGSLWGAGTAIAFDDQELRGNPATFELPLRGEGKGMSSANKKLCLDILPQPNDWTCGPTCLHAVYRYFDDVVTLDEVIRQTPKLNDGGTLAACLGCHALLRRYDATIYTFNLEVFDPTWFVPDGPDLIERLQQQRRVKQAPKLRAASRAYIDFLRLGGTILMQDLSAALIRQFLKKSIPILTGLSSTYLYGCPREFGVDMQPDDVGGCATGHFVVLCGYDKKHRKVTVADPYRANPLADDQLYEVSLDRLVCSILLGVLTYDANLLVIRPRRRPPARVATNTATQETEGEMTS